MVELRASSGEAMPQESWFTSTVGLAERALTVINAVVVTLGMCALLAASLILTYSVISRYFFGAATDWQDQVAVFCLIGAVFLSSAYVQSVGGHVAIEAVIGWLPPRADRVRRLFVHLCSLLFCGFFSWKAWALTHEAWVEGYRLAASFAPPLAIPYFMMALGTSLLTLQILLQMIVTCQKR
jgi:TRAP-type C4-dicarboxylate transport system permease small subunit